jgi:hypothetical protein
MNLCIPIFMIMMMTPLILSSLEALVFIMDQNGCGCMVSMSKLNAISIGSYKKIS